MPRNAGLNILRFRVAIQFKHTLAQLAACISLFLESSLVSIDTRLLNEHIDAEFSSRGEKKQLPRLEMIKNTYISSEKKRNKQIKKHSHVYIFIFYARRRRRWIRKKKPLSQFVYLARSHSIHVRTAPNGLEFECISNRYCWILLLKNFSFFRSSK